jgi:hypothetical protein
LNPSFSPMAYEYCNPRPEESQKTQPSTENDCMWHDCINSFKLG